MPIDTPLCLYEGAIPPEWIDYNGHMNVAYYVLAFDHATDGLMDYLGMDEAYRQRTRCSAFVLEAHINYRQELVEGDPIACTTQLLGFDSKRVHFFHRMYHREDDFLAATTEILLLHVDLGQRRSAAMPRDMLDRLGAIMTRHIQLPRPPETGRCMGIPKAS